MITVPQDRFDSVLWWRELFGGDCSVGSRKILEHGKIEIEGRREKDALPFQILKPVQLRLAIKQGIASIPSGQRFRQRLIDAACVRREF